MKFEMGGWKGKIQGKGRLRYRVGNREVYSMYHSMGKGENKETFMGQYCCCKVGVVSAKITGNKRQKG